MPLFSGFRSQVSGFLGAVLLAVHYWQFKPATVQGQPALVYAAFAVSFVPAPN
jgi:hypothetical protein